MDYNSSAGGVNLVKQHKFITDPSFGVQLYCDIWKRVLKNRSLHRKKFKNY
jgi:hypothetical protein